MHSTRSLAFQETTCTSCRWAGQSFLGITEIADFSAQTTASITKSCVWRDEDENPASRNPTVALLPAGFRPRLATHNFSIYIRFNADLIIKWYKLPKAPFFLYYVHPQLIISCLHDIIICCFISCLYYCLQSTVSKYTYINRIVSKYIYINYINVVSK